LVINLTVNDYERTLDIELGRLKNCLVVIQDYGYLEETRNKETGSAKMHIKFIKNNVGKYPEERKEAFEEKFTKLRELFNTLSSFLYLNYFFIFSRTLYFRKNFFHLFQNSLILRR
jgi:hypothetical protein